MTLLKPIAKLAAVLPILVASVALFGLMVLTFCDVILRSTFNAPIEAATELTRIAIAVIVFSALPLLSARGQHIAVDLLDPLFARLRLVRLRDGIVNIVCGVMLYYPSAQVVVLAQRAQSYGDRTEYLDIPTFYISWFIAILSFTTALVLVLRGAMILFAPSKLDLIRND